MGVASYFRIARPPLFFSKDRPSQLDATLRSLNECCRWLLTIDSLTCHVVLCDACVMHVAFARPAVPVAGLGRSAEGPAPPLRKDNQAEESMNRRLLMLGLLGSAALAMAAASPA